MAYSSRNYSLLHQELFHFPPPPLNKPRCYTGGPGIVIVQIPGGYHSEILSSFSLFSCANWRSCAGVREILSGSLLWNSSTTFGKIYLRCFLHHISSWDIVVRTGTLQLNGSNICILEETSMFVLFMFMLC